MRLKPVLVSLLMLLAWGGCKGEPTKSQYVSAVVGKECSDFEGPDRQACRIAVIKRFTTVSLEEMKAAYPPPEPWSRPGC